MSDLLDDVASGDTVRSTMFDVGRFVQELRTYYLLLAALIVLFTAVAIAVVEVMPPVYTATALVGPADNSDQPFGEGAGLGALANIGKHLHVGGKVGQTGGGQDTFDEFTSLLTSNRLAAVLARKDHLLQQVFANQWDATNKRWLPRSGLIANTVDFLKTLLRRPVKPAPDPDDLDTFFEKKLNVESSLDTQFATVTLKYGDPAEAERILGLILLEADNIIRQDKRRDVSARIAFLNNALEHLNLADQKPQLIDILSDQEQEMMMVESDHRYASVLIDPPHSPLKPTSPVPTIDGAMALGLACVAWLAAIRLTPERGRLRNLLEWFARPRRRKTRLGTPTISLKARTPTPG